jgi:hypothetical protein
VSSSETIESELNEFDALKVVIKDHDYNDIDTDDLDISRSSTASSKSSRDLLNESFKLKINTRI